MPSNSSSSKRSSTSRKSLSKSSSKKATKSSFSKEFLDQVKELDEYPTLDLLLLDPQNDTHFSGEVQAEVCRRRTKLTILVGKRANALLEQSRLFPPLQDRLSPKEGPSSVVDLKLTLVPLPMLTEAQVKALHVRLPDMRTLNLVVNLHQMDSDDIDSTMAQVAQLFNHPWRKSLRVVKLWIQANIYGALDGQTAELDGQLVPMVTGRDLDKHRTFLDSIGSCALNHLSMDLQEVFHLEQDLLPNLSLNSHFWSLHSVPCWFHEFNFVSNTLGIWNSLVAYGIGSPKAKNKVSKPKQTKIGTNQDGTVEMWLSLDHNLAGQFTSIAILVSSASAYRLNQIWNRFSQLTEVSITLWEEENRVGLVDVIPTLAMARNLLILRVTINQDEIFSRKDISKFRDSHPEPVNQLKTLVISIGFMDHHLNIQLLANFSRIFPNLEALSLDIINGGICLECGHGEPTRQCIRDYALSPVLYCKKIRVWQINNHSLAERLTNDSVHWQKI